MRLFIAALFGFAHLACAEAEAEVPCANKEVAFRETSATASAIANLRSARGSLRAETADIFNAADDELAREIAVCDAGCVEGARTIVFQSTPTKFLVTYPDRAVCEKLFEATSRNPFYYSGRTFPTLDAFTAWYNDFSQGKGKDGSDLYSRCTGSCSPQYHSEITRTSAGYTADTRVICGHARDKNDNTFALRARLRYVCRQQPE